MNKQAYKPFESEQWAQKYNSRNPVSRLLVKGFMDSVLHFANELQIKENGTVNEIGCGEGHVLGMLASNGYTVRGLDLDERNVAQARKNLPQIQIKRDNIFQLSGEDSADLIICCEVLEHLDEYEKAIEKICFLAKKYFIVSVPNEPLWRILNMTRLKYLKDFGNSPGHINHWSKKSFVKLVSKHAEILSIKNPLPFTVLLCKPKI